MMAINAKDIKLAPSILAADFARLGEQVTEAVKAGADRIHVDVMDGHFVPNISIGPLVVRSLRPITKLSLEPHLMISDPDKYLDDFAKAGSDAFIVHVEGNAHLHRTVQKIKALGKRAGVVFNPATPVGAIEEILQDVELVLVMTVNPGFGGQQFIQSTLQKIRKVRELIDRLRPGCDLEVDGGIEPHTIGAAAAAGQAVVGAGARIFCARGGAREGVPQLVE